MEWSVKTFKGKWSVHKRTLISKSLQKIILDFGITEIAMKTAHASRYSKGLQEVVADLKEFAEKEKTPLKIYTYADFAKNQSVTGRRVSIRKIIERLIETRFPELAHDLQKKENSRNPYYTKAFEAILAAIQ